tara:strand:- start:25724 stop:26467 length:744 start_codon:yes stop_codon:yes gene_type:complete
MIWAANWKMNLSPAESLDLLQSICESVPESLLSDFIVFPQNYSLGLLAKIVQHSNMSFGAQNVYPAKDGAYTGENSVEALKAMGADWALVAHSERRKYFAETNASAAEKIAFLQAEDIKPMYCIGESVEDREAGTTEEVLLDQLKVGLQKLDLQKDFAIAYEPVWAIGTGQVASPEQVAEAHDFIRRFLAEDIAKEVAARTPILYGGSVKPSNCEALAAVPHVDGFLIGGASLDTEQLCQIIEQTKN